MVYGEVKMSILSEQSTKHGRHESVNKLKLKHLDTRWWQTAVKLHRGVVLCTGSGTLVQL